MTLTEKVEWLAAHYAPLRTTLLRLIAVMQSGTPEETYFAARLLQEKLGVLAAVENSLETRSAELHAVAADNYAAGWQARGDSAARGNVRAIR